MILKEESFENWKTIEGQTALITVAMAPRVIFPRSFLNGATLSYISKSNTADLPI
jgi:hypothetical protein